MFGKLLLWYFFWENCAIMPQHLWHYLAADYKIPVIMSIRGNNVMYECSAWFVLLVISEKAKTWLPFFFSFNVWKRLWDSVFCDIQSSQGPSKNHSGHKVTQNRSSLPFMYFSGYLRHWHLISKWRLTFHYKKSLKWLQGTRKWMLMSKK